MAVRAPLFPRMTIADTVVMLPAAAVVPPIGVAILCDVSIPAAMAVPGGRAASAAVSSGFMPVTIAQGMTAGAGLHIMRLALWRRWTLVLAGLALLLGSLLGLLGCLGLFLSQLLCQLLLLQRLHLHQKTYEGANASLQSDA